jgi:hypothetical protein
VTRHISAGFDLRVPAESLPEDPSLTDQWLVPLNRSRISADAGVWPTPEEISDFYRGDLSAYPLGLLNDPDRLLGALHEHGIATVGFTSVCLTISGETAAALSEDHWADHFAVALREEDLLLRGWRFLGFDVAELNGLCSGLKGCGYKEPLWSQLRARFGGALNDVGLFSDATIASQFAGIRGLEIPSHAPFEVVGVLVHDASKE